MLVHFPCSNSTRGVKRCQKKVLTTRTIFKWKICLKYQHVQDFCREKPENRHSRWSRCYRWSRSVYSVPAASYSDLTWCRDPCRPEWSNRLELICISAASLGCSARRSCESEGSSYWSSGPRSLAGRLSPCEY